MLIKRSKREAPNSLSDYVRTYNHAIDIVTEAVGWANKVSTRKVAAIKLKPLTYRLFEEGLKLILIEKGQKLDEGTELFFEGYRILRGHRGQIDTVLFEYVENALNNKVVKPN